jgi:hypothetical protein
VPKGPDQYNTATSRECTIVNPYYKQHIPHVKILLPLVHCSLQAPNYKGGYSPPHPLCLSCTNVHSLFILQVPWHVQIPHGSFILLHVQIASSLSCTNSVRYGLFILPRAHVEMLHGLLFLSHLQYPNGLFIPRVQIPRHGLFILLIWYTFGTFCSCLIYKYPTVCSSSRVYKCSTACSSSRMYKCCTVCSSSSSPGPMYKCRMVCCSCSDEIQD